MMAGLKVIEQLKLKLLKTIRPSAVDDLPLWSNGIPVAILFDDQRVEINPIYLSMYYPS